MYKFKEPQALSNDTCVLGIAQFLKPSHRNTDKFISWSTSCHMELPFLSQKPPPKKEKSVGKIGYQEKQGCVPTLNKTACSW